MSGEPNQETSAVEKKASERTGEEEKVKKKSSSSNSGLQLVKIEPSAHIVFPGPLKTPVPVPIKITNITSQRIAWKVKVTAPNWYVVRPNSGFLEGKESADVTIELQPMRYDPNSKKVPNHRFLISAAPAGAGKTDRVGFWKNPKFQKIEQQHVRLYAIFQPPKEDSPAPGVTSPPTSQSQSAVSERRGSSEKVRKENEDLAKKIEALQNENEKLQKEALDRQQMANSPQPSAQADKILQYFSDPENVTKIAGGFLAMLFIYWLFFSGSKVPPSIANNTPQIPPQPVYVYHCPGNPYHGEAVGRRPPPTPAPVTGQQQGGDRKQEQPEDGSWGVYDLLF